MEEAALAAEVLHATTKLCVRQEFCEQFAESGGVETVLEVMRANQDKAVSLPPARTACFECDEQRM